MSTPFSDRAKNAMDLALGDREAAYEILSRIIILEQKLDEILGGSQPPTGEQEITFEDITGVVSVNQLPTKGLAIDQHTKVITENPFEPTIAFDGSVSDCHSVKLTGNASFSLINVSVNQEVTVFVIQDETGRWVVTWSAMITWAGDTVPTLSKKPFAVDIFKFVHMSDGSHIGCMMDYSFEVPNASNV